MRLSRAGAWEYLTCFKRKIAPTEVLISRYSTSKTLQNRPKLPGTSSVLAALSPARRDAIRYMKNDSSTQGARIEPWASVEEVTAPLGVARDTIDRWIEAKRMPAHR